MTLEERIAAVAGYGFTTRQAAFLTTVMLHAGVCVQRQYAQFAGLANGHAIRDFFDRLTRDRFATAHACWRQGGRLYHVHHKGLYRAIGEQDNRHRRATTLPRAIERLMVLDVVLAFPETAWLATEREKVTYFAHRHAVPTHEMPALVFEAHGSKSVRYFPEKLPVGTSGTSDDVTLIYMATEPDPSAFRTFLAHHRPLLQRVGRWRLRIVLPSFLAFSRASYLGTFAAFCAPPVRSSVVEDFRWFCHARRGIETGGRKPVSAADEARYAAARRAFGAPRFYGVYRAWLREGDSVFSELLSPLLHERLQRDEIGCESYVLPHQYQHLASVVASA
jgi:hypothetical protein